MFRYVAGLLLPSLAFAAVACEPNESTQYDSPPGAKLIEVMSLPDGFSGGSSRLRAFAFDGSLAEVASAYAVQHPEADVLQTGDGWQFETEVCVIVEDWSPTWHNLVSRQLFEGARKQLDDAPGSFVEITLDECNNG